MRKKCKNLEAKRIFFKEKMRGTLGGFFHHTDHTVKDSLPLFASVNFSNRFPFSKNSSKGKKEEMTKIKLLCHILTMESLKCVKNMPYCTLLANSYKHISFRIHCTWLHCDFLSIKSKKTWNQDVVAKIRRKLFCVIYSSFTIVTQKKNLFIKSNHDFPLFIDIRTHGD